MAPNYLQSGRAKIKALKNHTGKISSLEDKKRKKKMYMWNAYCGTHLSPGYPKHLEAQGGYINLLQISH